MGVLRAHFEKTFPALAEHIACMMLTSPFTLSEQIHHKESSMYGVDAYRTIDPAIQSRTGVKGLYLSGEDTFVNGVTLATGTITAACVAMDAGMSSLPKAFGNLLLQLPRLIVEFIEGNPDVKLPEKIREMLTAHAPSHRSGV